MTTGIHLGIRILSALSAHKASKRNRTRRKRGIRFYHGWVEFEQLKSDIDAGYRYFWSRPHRKRVVHADTF